MKLYECVPNVSEGRDRDTLDAMARAIDAAGATLAHRTSDAVHHRSVFTFFGEREAVLAAAVALAGVAVSLIDLRTHRGAHPRIGALDVLPFVPLGSATMHDAVGLAHEAALLLWERFQVPSVFYGAAATKEERRLLADVRAGEFEGLVERGHRGGPPDTGTTATHPTAGATAIGAREILVAFNVVLRSGDLAIAREIARTLRERGGGLRTLRALGIALGDGRVQVSCNITDYRATPLHRVAGLIRAMAARRGVAVEGCELIGLLPRQALLDLAAHEFGAAMPQFAP